MFTLKFKLFLQRFHASLKFKLFSLWQSSMVDALYATINGRGFLSLQHTPKANFIGLSCLQISTDSAEIFHSASFWMTRSCFSSNKETWGIKFHNRYQKSMANIRFHPNKICFMSKKISSSVDIQGFQKSKFLSVCQFFNLHRFFGPLQTLKNVHRTKKISSSVDIQVF